MSLDNTPRQQVRRITATEATKLIPHDGTPFITLKFTTSDGPQHFFTDMSHAEQLADALIQALHSDGLTPLT